MFCRDRTSSVWPMVCDHLHTLLMASAVSEQEFLIERCVIGLLRLAIRLIRRDEITSSVSGLIFVIVSSCWIYLICNMYVKLITL